MAHRLWVQRNERFVIFRIFSIPGTQRYPRFKNCAVPSGTQLLKFARYPVPSGTQLSKFARYPVPSGTQFLKFAWYPVPSGTQFLKFPRYPVPSGTQIFKISMGTGRYPGTHGYRGTARADPWSSLQYKTQKLVIIWTLGKVLIEFNLLIIPVRPWGFEKFPIAKDRRARWRNSTNQRSPFHFRSFRKSTTQNFDTWKSYLQLAVFRIKLCS